MLKLDESWRGAGEGALSNGKDAALFLSADHVLRQDWFLEDCEAGRLEGLAFFPEQGDHGGAGAHPLTPRTAAAYAHLRFLPNPRQGGTVTPRPRLEGRVSIITGTNGVIGRGIARELAAAGSDVGLQV